MVSGVRELCIAARPIFYQPTLAPGTPEVAFGVTVVPPETFSPGTEDAPDCSVTVPESVLAQELKKQIVTAIEALASNRKITARS
jgi:hypothetical protein